MNSCVRDLQNLGTGELQQAGPGSPSKSPGAGEGEARRESRNGVQVRRLGGHSETPLQKAFGLDRAVFHAETNTCLSLLTHVPKKQAFRVCFQSRLS